MKSKFFEAKRQAKLDANQAAVTLSRKREKAILIELRSVLETHLSANDSFCCEVARDGVPEFLNILRMDSKLRATYDVNPVTDVLFIFTVKEVVI